MAEWVRVCALDEVPSANKLVRVEAGRRDICLANIEGELYAVDNICPHRQGPLDEGWVEEGKIVCPWHGWSFDPLSGLCTNAQGQVQPFGVKVENDEVLILIS